MDVLDATGRNSTPTGADHGLASPVPEFGLATTPLDPNAPHDPRRGFRGGLSEREVPAGGAPAAPPKPEDLINCRWRQRGVLDEAERAANGIAIRPLRIDR